MTGYPNGTPSWVDLATTDADAARAFYAQLFGWATTEPSAEHGGYANFLDGDRRVAGLNPMGEFAAWSTYVSVDDADATAAKVAEHGGTAMFEPMDVGDLGRMAVFTDPGGAVFGIWQPKEFGGAEKVNEPNSLTWNELHSRDLDAVTGFYEAVFGWTANPMDMGGMTYTILNLGEKGIGGAMTMGPETPADAPPHWMVWFAVADTDATFAKAKELGASEMMAPMDAPGVGRLASVIDPQGAAFGVIKAEMPDE